MEIELDDDDAPRSKNPVPRPRPAARPQDPAASPERRSSGAAGPPSSRGLQIRRHSREKRPTGLGGAFASMLLAVALTAATPFIGADGIARLRGWLGDLDYVPYAVFGVAVLIAWALLLARAIQRGSLGLYLSAVALAAEMVLLGLVAAAATGSAAAEPFLRIMPVGAPLAGAAAVFGLGLRGLRRAGEEWKGSDRRVALGLLFGLIGLCGVALSVRIARFDLPLPRVGEPLRMVVW